MGVDLVVTARARLLLLAGRTDDALAHLRGSWEFLGATGVDVTLERFAFELVCALTIAGRGDDAEAIVANVREWSTRDPMSRRLRRVQALTEAVAARRIDAAMLVLDDGRDPWVQDRRDQARLLTALFDAAPGRAGAEQPGPSTPAPAGVPDSWSRLSAAEQRVCLAIGRGLSNKAIAAELFLSIRTVETHVSRILRKMGVPSRLQLGLLVRPLVEGSDAAL